MDESASCGYTHTYNDVRTGIARDYRCTRPWYGGARSCIFHTATGIDHEEIRKAFVDELESEPYQGEGDPLLFIGCRMPTIDIEGLSTERSVYFTDAKFEGDVVVSDVACGAIDFTDAEFAGQLRMVATDTNTLRLRKAHFGPRHGNPTSADGGDRATIDLHGCSFKSYDMALVSVPSVRILDCDFADAQLRGSTIVDLYVRECTFANSADFAFCKIGQSRFDMVRFGGPATFEGTSFERASRFMRAHFQQQDLVRFCRALSNVSFLSTNMTKIRFDADTVWNDDGSYAILDERELANNLSKSSLSDTLAVYRSLRECHEYWLMYEEAGQFYIREMDMRRCYGDALGEGVARRRVRRYISLVNGYNVLCRYGESFGRASAWVAGVFAAASVYYYLCPDPVSPAAQADTLSRLTGALERTLAAFLHAGRGGIDDHLVRVASLPVLGSMFIVIKRRLERRFRH